jgi:hypothetical protein
VDCGKPLAFGQGRKPHPDSQCYLTSRWQHGDTQSASLSLK